MLPCARPWPRHERPRLVPPCVANDRSSQVLNIPDSLCDHPANRCFRLPGATVVSYVTAQSTPATPFLVTQPTLTFVHSGIKQLRAHGAADSAAALPGSMAVMRSGTHMMTEVVGAGVPFRSTVVSVKRDLLRATIGVAPNPVETARALVCPIPPHLQELVSALPDWLEQQSEGFEGLLKIRQILVLAMNDERVRAMLFREASSWGDNHDDRIQAVMNAHCFSPLSVVDYAALAAMSLSAFERHFNNLYGQSPGRWLTRTRLHHARSLLLTGDRPVTDICYDCGYGDLSNFIRAFRRAYGTPPAHYRRAQDTHCR